ncbi:ribonuclease H family protein [Bifidobacterium choloepi]|uniref:ribonuclease H n=1 Tax=Bifidobacterium choloepi TaxID=2614131 RepID=A0A6I5MZA5_9BIFI|nr:ribonuclease H [Bifidobacterium choloepi]NEG69617.1 ribonuclease HI [Bifidobacterium choloepi]
MTITVSTDGSALGNPNGPMGWAWADHHDRESDAAADGHRHAGDCDAGGATNGTNQIGELCAVLEALRTHPGSEPLVIETDSQYAINCSTKWVRGWKKNGWKNSQKKPVKNADVIKAIDAEISRRPGPVRFVWVKGHAGNAGNEKVDTLARTYAGDCRSGAREGYLPKEGWQSLLASEYSRGTDVPDDARLLLDGKISAADYRGLVHGEPPEEDPDDSSARPSANRMPVAAEPEGFDPDDWFTDGDDKLEPEPETEPEPEPEDKPSPESTPAAPRLRATGLTASGTLKISPAPATSPTFDGRPRHVRGYLAVEGYVDGDGTFVVRDAPFLM